MKETVEKWDIFEVESKGYTRGNPFVDYAVKGVFTGKNERVEVDGFYDGQGIYRVRFMPSFTGEYTYEVSGSALETSLYGKFQVTEPSENNHGPVRVASTYHFAYEDGTPYYSVGTTCYVWTHQSQAMQEETLKTLSRGYFNKIRFCIFPKHYAFNINDPITFPYEGTPMDSSLLTNENFGQFGPDSEGNNWDFERFNPEHFKLIEKRIADLRDLGIEADLIVMHAYDRWGFSTMNADQDDLYWKYIIARFAAYRNVWWSLANEYDLLRSKTTADWERYAQILCEKDPYNRLRSIHNCADFYDHSRPWITHCSIQRTDTYRTTENGLIWREKYKKPVVFDEITYEGNVNHCWGNITGKELVRRFWEAAVRGCYAGHGETYMDREDKLWWSKGGKLKGTSPARIKFLHIILSETPGLGLIPSHDRNNNWDEQMATAHSFSARGSYFLAYYGRFCPSYRDYYIDDDHLYDVEIIDTWEMTIKKAGTFKGRFRVDLPGKEFMAVRIIRTKSPLSHDSHGI